MACKMLTLTQKSGGYISVIHPVIFYNDSELILCDAGYPNQAEQINEELSKHGFSVKDITRIIITHHDHDHIGSLKQLKEWNRNLIVTASVTETPFIEGKAKSLRLIQAEEFNKSLSGKDLESGMQFVSYLNTIQTCSVDKQLSDGEYIIPGLKTILTPGHTPGHISLFCEESRVLITGDALAVEDSKPVIANPEFTLDIKSCIESIKKISNSAPQKIICYHGGLIEDNITNQLEEIINNQ